MKRKDVCETCRVGDARYQATHRERDETWLVCERCRDQGRRYGAPIDYRDLIRTRCPSCSQMVAVVALPATCPHCETEIGKGI